jgi:hypothetical protein
MQEQFVFGIDAKRIYALNRLSDDSAVARGVISIFQEYGYDVGRGVEGIRDTQAAVSYGTDTVRVHFNLPTSKVLKTAILVPPGFVNDAMIPEALRIAGTRETQLFVEASLEQLRRFMLQGKHVTVHIQMTMEDGSVVIVQSQEFTVDSVAKGPKISVRDLSTLPEGDENRDEENVVLTLLKESAHLYFDDLTAWSVNLASTAHDGTAVNAVDFIRGNANNAPVVAPYAGTVVFNGKDSGGNPTLVLEHSVEVEGRTMYWYTKYLHMHTNIDGLVYILNKSETEVALTPGMQLAAGDPVGLTGSEGNSSGPHLHQELLIASNGRKIVQEVIGEKSGAFFTTKAVDQRLLLTTGERTMSVVATAGYMENGDFQNLNPPNRKLAVTWDNTVGAWVSTEYGLVYDRREQEGVAGGSGSYWLAYERDVALGEMVRVRWVHELSDGRVVDTWLKANDHSQKWNPQMRTWESI